MQRKQQVNQALFFAIAKQDYVAAKQLLSANANPNAIYQIQKSKFISTYNLYVTKCALLGAKKGPTTNQYKACASILKQMTSQAILECKCIDQHKCPLYIALQIFKITQESQIVQGNCQLIRFLILNGASLKTESKTKKKLDKSMGGWKLRWLDIDGIRSYLVTKKFTYLETKS